MKLSDIDNKVFRRGVLSGRLVGKTIYDVHIYKFGGSPRYRVYFFKYTPPALAKHDHFITGKFRVCDDFEDFMAYDFEIDTLNPNYRSVEQSAIQAAHEPLVNINHTNPMASLNKLMIGIVNSINTRLADNPHLLP